MFLDVKGLVNIFRYKNIAISLCTVALNYFSITKPQIVVKHLSKYLGSRKVCRCNYQFNNNKMLIFYTFIKQSNLCFGILLIIANNERHVFAFLCEMELQLLRSFAPGTYHLNKCDPYRKRLKKVRSVDHQFISFNKI